MFCDEGNDMRKAPVFLLILLVALAAACGQNNSTPVGNATSGSTTSDTSDQTSFTSVVAGNNAFAFELYPKIKGDGNLFFSPYSILEALAMTYGGARGQTAAEMQKVLHFTSGQQIHPAFARLDAQLAKVQQSGIELLNADSLFSMVVLLPAYQTLIKTNYSAPIEPVEFPEPGRTIINKWVEDRTKTHIKGIIPEGALDDLTRLVLVNAIYFKGKWAAPFDPRMTLHDDFKLIGGNKINIPMMHGVGEQTCGRMDGAQLLELAYVGDRLAMDIVLPDEPEGIGKIEDRLTLDALKNALDQMVKTKIIVGLPKFKMTWGTTDLAEPLQTMGMPTPFDQDKADFSGMTGGRTVYIRYVFHKAFVEVNEEGSEAAAATAVVMPTISKPEPMPPSFIADHPFIFLIRDKATGQILFIGRMTDPREKKES